MIDWADIIDPGPKVKHDITAFYFVTRPQVQYGL
jgi:hypothetical protein